MNGENDMKLLKNSLITIVGTFILAVAVTYLILPYNILSGGVAGIAIALEPIFNIPRMVTINCLVYGMFIIGFIFLGKSFAINTVISSVTYPMFIVFLENLDFEIVGLTAAVASLYGGIIAGFGIGLVLKVGSSTGGMDIPPLILHKLTGDDTSKFVLIVDGATVLLGILSYGLEAVLIGMISVVATSWIIDKTLTFGGSNAKSIQIISEHWEILNERLNKELDRGTTLISAQGGYTLESKMIVLVIIDKKQYPRLIEIVNSIDSKAFMITSEVQDVHGEGFKLEFRV